MRKILLAASALALAFGSGAATAAPLVLSPTVVTPITPPASGTFGNSFNPAVAGTSFTDNFVFNLSSGANTDASLITIALNGVQNIDFACATCSVRLDSQLFTLMQSGNLDIFTLNPTLLSSGNHTLALTGFINAGPSASYSGTINFNTPAVPEPATWAMMLLGFGGIGTMMRRRNRKTVFAQIA